MAASSTSPSFARLGKRELGRHAFEEQMPQGLLGLISTENEANALPGVIPKLARLLDQDRDLKYAYLCQDSAVQVYRVADEGGHFCGYRNLQMLLLALQSEPATKPLVPEGKPTIPLLQDMIENAWASGHNQHGLQLTGGIRGTRKHIGTSEAEAVLLNLGVPCVGAAFQGRDAWRQLLDFVVEYYSLSPSKTGPGAHDSKVHTTSLPPIFLQRPNHSITIVGYACLNSGNSCLLTFDPAWAPPSAMREPLSRLPGPGLTAAWLLRKYRKSEWYLKRYTGFETLSIAKQTRPAKR